ncbi:hypothetical protein QJS10_CPB15g00896 [Acorus calamus]|uniref:OTU domain-containing protein n=1 Tax=Acorus calamus TaxID=4465 RepID=A0AAV9D5P0_ACOCL|nr:hypothetical protein QJS10_CPB15g00896 [Acorus calamus]
MSDETTQKRQAGVLQLGKRPKMVVQRSSVLRSRSMGAHKYIDELPPFLTPFILNVHDVLGDGHCGFRVVAYFLKMTNFGWRYVRNDLLIEIEEHPDLNERVFYGWDRVEEVKTSLQCHSYTAGKEHWMIMPDMEFMISSCYKIIVVHISRQQCLTYFPLRDPPPSLLNTHHLLSIGYLEAVTSWVWK